MSLRFPFQSIRDHRAGIFGTIRIDCGPVPAGANSSLPSRALTDGHSLRDVLGIPDCQTVLLLSRTSSRASSTSTVPRLGAIYDFWGAPKRGGCTGATPSLTSQRKAERGPSAVGQRGSSRSVVGRTSERTISRAWELG